MIKMSLYQFIAGVADDGFGQGGAAPPTHASLTLVPRHMSWQPVSASPRGKEKTAVNSSGTGTGGERVSRRPQDAKRTPPAKGKKMPGEGFGNGGPFLLLFLLVLYWQKLQKCCVVAPRNSQPVVSSRSIVNESCHRRCFAWLAFNALLSRECPVVLPPASFFACMRASQVVRDCIAVMVMC